MKATRLPWVNRRVIRTENLAPLIRKELPRHFKHQVPGSITIYSDIPMSDIVEPFFEKVEYMVRAFRIDFLKRLPHEAGLSDVGLMQTELRDILNKTRRAQPWVIYNSHQGGLRLSEGGSITPCTTMSNHAIAWNRNRTYLVTARKYREKLDLDSDISHESAHALLGGLPFFAHQIGAQVWNTSLPSSATNVSAAQTAKIWYGLCEIAATTMIGEIRETETSLPVVETWQDLEQFVSVMSELLPSKGFGVIDPSSDNFRYQIGAAAIRCMPHLAQFVNRFNTPSASELFSL